MVNLRVIKARRVRRDSQWPLMDRKNRKVRGRHGWTPSDTWSFDSYLATVIADGLTYFRGHLHGHPGNLTEDEWNRILDDMIDGFVAWRDKEHGWTQANEDEAYRKVQKSIRLMHRWFGHLWD